MIGEPGRFDSTSNLKVEIDSKGPILFTVNNGLSQYKICTFGNTQVGTDP